MAKLHKKSHFGSAPNNLLNDGSISWKAKGLFVYIESKPDDWDFSVERVCNDSKDGKDSTRAGIKELEHAGYLERIQVRLDNGTWDHEWELHWEPIHIGKSDIVTTAENPPSDIPTSETPPTNKERDTKKEIEFISTNVDINEQALVPTEESEEKIGIVQEYGKREINEALAFLSKIIGIDEFKEPVAKQRQYANHIVKLSEKTGKDEFAKRLKGILSDGFKKKNCNSIVYLYRELKSFIDNGKTLIPEEKKVLNKIGVL